MDDVVKAGTAEDRVAWLQEQAAWAGLAFGPAVELAEDAAAAALIHDAAPDMTRFAEPLHDGSRLLLSTR